MIYYQDISACDCPAGDPDCFCDVVDRAFFCDRFCAPEEVLPSFNTYESDYPHHCATCGDAVPLSLTGDGVEYVRSHIIDHLVNPSYGDAHTIQDWIATYGDQLDHDSEYWLQLDSETFQDPQGLADRLEISTLKDLLDCSRPGNNESAVEYFESVYIDHVDSEALVEFLGEQGAWLPEDLQDDEENVLRAIWVLAGYVRNFLQIDQEVK